jgi:hypothetical protein
MIHPEVGTIFMWSFIFIQNITLLNFVVAILSNTYSITTANSEAVYLKSIIGVNQSIGYNPGNSALVSAPPGFNLLFVMFWPSLIK